MTRIRYGLATLLLLVVCCWPALHIYFSAASESNPWKFYGFAMYTIPGFDFEAHIYDISVPEAPELDPLSEYEHDTLEQWMYAIAAVGPRAEPDAVVRAVFAERPDVMALRIEFYDLFYRTKLDRIGSRVFFWEVVRTSADTWNVYPSRDDHWVDAFVVPTP